MSPTMQADSVLLIHQRSPLGGSPASQSCKSILEDSDEQPVLNTSAFNEGTCLGLRMQPPLPLSKLCILMSLVIWVSEQK